MTKNEFETLFSRQRLQSYTSEREHLANFVFIGHLAHKIGLLDIIIRNKIDAILSSSSPRWIYAFKDIMPAFAALPAEQFERICRHELISKQGFGFWVKVDDFTKKNRAFGRHY